MSKMKNKDPFPWLDDYIFEIDAIDGQHKQLVTTINALHHSSNSPSHREDLNDIIKSLNKYVITHFRYEERQMELARFPELEEHKAMHREFESELKQLAETHMKKRDVRIDGDLLTMLGFWLQNHILIEDKKYLPYLKEKS